MMLFYRNRISDYYRSFICARCFSKNHYEVLGLEESCSAKDIKDAFLHKSKELHPDKNKSSSKNHELFVAVNDAYSVLSKSDLRYIYDSQLARKRSPIFRPSKSTKPDYHHVHKVYTYEDFGFYNEADDKNFKYKRSMPYYGIKGIERLSNQRIGVSIIVFMIFGAIIQFFIYKKTSSYLIEKLDEKDARIVANSVRPSEEKPKNAVQEAIEHYLIKHKTDKGVDV